MAAERGVRVYTVGIGTPNGEIIAGEGWRMRVRLDEDALKGIAKETRGEYFYAGTATDLKKIYSNLNSRLVMERKETEVTALFAAGAALFALLSALLSLPGSTGSSDGRRGEGLPSRGRRSPAQSGLPNRSLSLAAAVLVLRRAAGVHRILLGDPVLPEARRVWCGEQASGHSVRHTLVGLELAVVEGDLEDLLLLVVARRISAARCAASGVAGSRHGSSLQGRPVECAARSTCRAQCLPRRGVSAARDPEGIRLRLLRHCSAADDSGARATPDDRLHTAGRSTSRVSWPRPRSAVHEGGVHPILLELRRTVAAADVRQGDRCSRVQPVLQRGDQDLGDIVDDRRAAGRTGDHRRADRDRWRDRRRSRLPLRVGRPASAPSSCGGACRPAACSGPDRTRQPDRYRVPGGEGVLPNEKSVNWLFSRKPADHLAAAECVFHGSGHRHRVAVAVHDRHLRRAAFRITTGRAAGFRGAHRSFADQHCAFGQVVAHPADPGAVRQNRCRPGSGCDPQRPGGRLR